MDVIACGCGSKPTHRCIKCEPAVALCLRCIESHLRDLPEDGLIPLTSYSEFNINCSKCQVESSDFLGMFEGVFFPICRKCKKLLRTDSLIFISLKWKEIVKDYRDLQEIGYRKRILWLTYQEIERFYRSYPPDSHIDAVKDSIIQTVIRLAKSKKEENRQKTKLNSEAIKRLKKEVEIEILKKYPDVSTDAGKFIKTVMNNGTVPIKYDEAFSIPSTELSSLVQNLFNKLLLPNKTQDTFIYLFNFGRPTITRINIEKLSRQNFMFDRNWTFEASWCELQNHELFFCGGNGLNSPDVLIVNPETLNISIRKPFLGRSGHAVVEVSNVIYVFGGNRGKIADRYCLEMNCWESLPEMPSRILRTSACAVNERVLMGGIDCVNILAFDMEREVYEDLGEFVECFRTNNKILFSHGELVYCICGNKVFFCHFQSLGEWKTAAVVNKDWWSYSKPVVYNGCAYFIKYFVKNLWKLDLNSFELTEIFLNDLKNEI